MLHRHFDVLALFKIAPSHRPSFAGAVKTEALVAAHLGKLESELE